MEGEGGGAQSQTNQQPDALLTTQENYSQAAHGIGRPLTIAKGPTLANVAAESTHCR